MKAPFVLACCWLSASVVAQSLTATVNDPMSHGMAADGMLSLDEAIRLANGTLALASLSAAEQSQISGTGTMVGTIEVMAMTTPTIMVQSPLTPITGMMQGPRIALMGMAMQPHGMPMLMGNTQATVLALRTHRVDVMGLMVDGGQVAVDVQQMPMSGAPMSEMAMVMDCEFVGQTNSAIALHGMGSDESMLMLMRSRFANLPVGIRLLDQTTGTGLLMSESEGLTMTNVGIGIDVQDDGNGLMSMAMLFRSEFTGGTLCRLRRGSSANQFMFRIVHTHATCTGDVTDVQGNSQGLTMFHHHHGDFRAGVGRKAFWVYPRSAVFDVHGSEMEFVGDVAVTGNTFSPRCWQQNNHYQGGTVTYDCDGALPNLLWNRYDNVQFVVPSTARSPVLVRGSELRNSTVDCQSLFATTTLTGCYRQGGAVTGLATEVSAAPSAFLGTASIGPTAPQIGATLQLQCDLPFGFGAFWDLAFSYARPITTAEPVRFYGDPSSAVVLPGMAIFHSTTLLPLPNLTALVGLELYVQPVTIPLLGQSWAPTYHLPRGQLVRPTL